MAEFEDVDLDSEDEDMILIACAAVVAEEEEEQERRPRSVWTKEWLLRRKSYGAYDLSLQELIEEDPKETKRFLRMSYQNFQELLRRLSRVLSRS